MLLYVERSPFDLTAAPCIGQGYFGTVFRCEYHGRAGAVKRIPRSQFSDSEVECLRRLQHNEPARGQVHDDLHFVANLVVCLVDDENVYVVTELVCSPQPSECGSGAAAGAAPATTTEGRCGHLGDLIERYRQRRSRCPPEKVFMIMWQCLRGLAAAHRQGCSHGDLKPNNIVLEEHSVSHWCGLLPGKHVEVVRCVLIDFGCGAVFPVGCPPPTAPTGSPGYRELVESGADATQSDVWSLGITFLGLYMGWHPLNGVADGAAALIHERFKLFELLVLCGALAGPANSIETDIMRILSRMIKCDPAQRASAAELLALASEVSESAHCNSFIVDDTTMATSGGVRLHISVDTFSRQEYRF